MASSPDRVPKPKKNPAVAIAAILAADEPNKKKFKKDAADAAAAHSAALAAAAAGGNKAAAKIAAALSSTPQDEEDEEDEDAAAAADWEPATQIQPLTAAAAAAAAVELGGIQEPVKPKNDVGAAQTRELFTAFSAIKKLHNSDLLNDLVNNHFSNDSIYKFLGMDRPINIQIAERDDLFISVDFCDFKAMKKNRFKIGKTTNKKPNAGRPKKKNNDECAFSIISVKDKLFLLSTDDNLSVFSPDTNKKIGTLLKIADEHGNTQLRIKPL